jgi:hypothetical protein
MDLNLNAPNFEKLLEAVPEGDWAAISPDGTKVLTYGPELEEVMRKAPEGTIIRKFTGHLILNAV